MSKTSKKLNITKLMLLAIVIVLSAMVLVCCSKTYTPKYSTENCNIRIKVKNTSDIVSLAKKFDNDGAEIYFGNDITDAETVDFTIENLIEAYSTLKNNDLLKDDFSIVISNNFVPNCWKDEVLGLCVSLPIKVSPEETIAWCLYAQNRESDLPFGVYAGISVLLCKSTLGGDFDAENIVKDAFYTDLQFPLYETGNLAENDRKIAFGFAKNVVEGLLSDGKTYLDILSMDKEDLSSVLAVKYDVNLSEYTVESYSTRYEYKIKQGCFTYFINKEYKDIILPDEVFSTSYDKLRDWLKDNEKTTAESNAVFNVAEMYDIKVYLEDGLKSNGTTGYAHGDYIDLYSVGSFSHEYIHHILFYLGKSGIAREVIPEMHANTSKYARAMWYYLFSNQAQNFPYNQDVKEKESYSATMRLYEKYSANKPTIDNFDFWLFANCFSAIYTSKGTPFINRVQTDSLAYYIARVYGANYVWELNMNPEIVIEGKPYREVVAEWYDYIATLNH